MLYLFRSICISLMFLFPTFTYGGNQIPLGTYAKNLVTIDVILNDTIMANFVVDTGSSFVVVGSKTFSHLESTVGSEADGVAQANIGDGSSITLFLYNISSFMISGCVLHDVVIAVNMSDDVNVIGWNVLDRIQPITFNKDKMILTGTRCE